MINRQLATGQASLLKSRLCFQNLTKERSPRCLSNVIPQRSTPQLSCWGLILHQLTTKRRLTEIRGFEMSLARSPKFTFWLFHQHHQRNLPIKAEPAQEQHSENSPNCFKSCLEEFFCGTDTTVDVFHLYALIQKKAHFELFYKDRILALTLWDQMEILS